MAVVTRASRGTLSHTSLTLMFDSPPSTKHRAPSTKRRAPSTKCPTPAFFAALLLISSCGGASGGGAKMPQYSTEDAADGVIGGGTPTGEVVGDYASFQVLGCTQGDVTYVAPPPGRLQLVSASGPHHPSDIPTAVLRSDLRKYPREIHNAYAEAGERMWLAYRPEGEAYQVVLPLDWSEARGRTQLLRYDPGTYEIVVTGNQYRIRGTPRVRCQLAVLWVGTHLHPKFTPPTEAELNDLTLDYKASLAVDSKRHDTKARRAARLLGYEGINTMHIGEYESAAQLLELAWSELGTPSLALWSARALAEAGRTREATARYAAAAELPTDRGDPNVERRAQASAAAELTQLLKVGVSGLR